MTKKTSEKWYEDEFSSIDFNDKRLKHRFWTICDDFNKSPQAIVSQSIEGFHQCKAAYRFFKNNKVSAEAFLKAHHVSIKKRLGDEEEYLLEIQDSSELNFTSHSKTTELGPIGNGASIRGLEMHSSIICTERGLVLGVGSCYIWARDKLNKCKGKDYRFTAWKDKESIKWADALEAVDDIGIDEKRRVTVTDREGDFYEFLEKFETEKRQMIIRLRWNRKIKQSNKNVCEFVSSQVSAGLHEIKIASKGGKQPREERTTKIEIRFTDVDFMFTRLPKGKIKKELGITVIHAKEITPLSGEEGIEWFLITNLNCKDVEQATRIVKCYAKRWLIEEFHKILKGAIRIEEARLSTGARLEKLIVFLAIFSCRLLWISRLSRLDPEAPCEVCFKEEEWRYITKRINKQEVEKTERPTISSIVIGIAKLGGYWGRKSDPPPGIIVLWRGMMRLYEALDGIETMNFSKERCGY